MVVVSQQTYLDHFPALKTCKSASFFTGIPVVDLTDPNAKDPIVKACEEFGFFKVVNHGVPLDLIIRLEAEAARFFSLPQFQKEKAGPVDPYGYGSKRIGPNGDVGWVEYLLLHTDPQLMMSHKSSFIFQENFQTFRWAIEEYVREVKEMACEVMEKVAEGLGIEPKNVMSKLLREERSDSCFRVNHYPPCPSEMQQGPLMSGRNLVGFGEHTDPQIISVLRSNNTSGLQISLQDDGTWVSVPPDHNSFFFIVGDSLQVMTNGRVKSVKHRVLADNIRSRISMIYFGGPPLSEKIAPLPSLMEEGEESRYKEFTWSEYKKSAYKSRLADYRLGPFEKTTTNKSNTPI